MKATLLLTLCITLASFAIAQHSNIMDKKTFLSMIMQEGQFGADDLGTDEAYIAQQEKAFSACAGAGYKQLDDKNSQIMPKVLNQCSANLPAKVDVMSPDVQNQLAGFNSCIEEKIAKLQNISTTTHRHCKHQTDPDVPIYERIEKAKTDAEKQALIKLKEYEY